MRVSRAYVLEPRAAHGVRARPRPAQADEVEADGPRPAAARIVVHQLALRGEAHGLAVAREVTDEAVLVAELRNATRSGRALRQAVCNGLQRGLQRGYNLLGRSHRDCALGRAPAALRVARRARVCNM